MTGAEVRRARQTKHWTQADLAVRLRVSQAYVSMLESNRRQVPHKLQPKLVALLGLPASHLPLTADVEPLSEDDVAAGLAALGYPGFAHLRRRRKVNPAELLVRTLRGPRVEARVVEALPWLLLSYPALDWPWVVQHAKQHDLQNRLGFVVTVARELAERSRDDAATKVLRQTEEVLERSRLQKEDSFAGEHLTNAERRWLATNRSPEAARWNMLSNLTADTLTRVTTYLTDHG